MTDMKVNNYDAALALIVDRSGSMWNVASQTKDSVKEFIVSQKGHEGTAALKVVQFDDQYEVVHDFVDLKTVDENKFAEQYTPRGMTALLDAIGRTTLELSQKLESMDEAQRPKRVMVAVITDGYENASKEFTVDKIKSMIEEKEKLGWDFMFLGATLDTMDVAKNYGIAPEKAVYYDQGNVKRAFKEIDVQCLHSRLGKKVEILQTDREELAKQN